MIITSTTNKLIKEIMNIKGKGKKSKNSLLYFEGLRIVNDIIESGAEVYSLILRESEVEKYPHLTDKYPYTIVSDKVFKELSGTVTSQGIALLAHKPKNHLISPQDLVLVVDKVQDPGNLGTIIRTALAAGVEAVYLLKGTVDIFNEKTLRSTMGSIYKIPVYYDVELEEIKQLIDDHKFVPLKGCPRGQYTYNKVPKGKYMVFVGNEGNGISQDVEELDGITVRIPLYGDIESLNVAVATGLILYGVKDSNIK